MGKKYYAVIADHLTLPIDEGLKKMTFELMKFASSLENVDIYSSPDNIGVHGVTLYRSNKLMFSSEIRNILHKRVYTDIIYIPNTSATFYSFIRSWLISLQTSGEVLIHLINSQERFLKSWQYKLVRLMENVEVVSFSRSSSERYKKQNMLTKVLPCGVDIDIFRPIADKEKLSLRKKYKFPLDKNIVLHVGHIRKSRNISILKELQVNGFQVIVVGSTSMAFEKELANELSECGMIILSDYNPHVEELYQLSDLYVFPVWLPDAAIEFPLSVLEAMACGIPVLTTRFGALTDVFNESSCFGFFNNEYELLTKAKDLAGKDASINREIIVEKYSWKSVMEKLFEE